MTRRERRPGYELPLLLVGAFRWIIDELHEELAAVGHPRARPLHGFALQAIGSEGVTVSELGRRLGVSKQAAAKTAASLEGLRYVTRAADAEDARAVRLTRTGHGEAMLAASAAIFERINRRLADTLGTDRLMDLEDSLAEIARDHSLTKLGDLPGWLR